MTVDQVLLHRREEDGTNVAPESTAADASAASHYTNETVVSRLLESGHTLSTSFMQSTLDLLNDPRFYRPSVTLRNYSDVFAYDASARIEAAANRSRLASSIRNFPPTVLENIVDLVEKNRCIAADLDNPFAVFEDGTTEDIRRTVQETLENMSLVHRSWTWPAQKALGHELRLSSDENDVLQLLRRAISSVHFGPWTKRAFFSYRRKRPSESDYAQRASVIAEFDNELAKLLVEVLKRLLNLKQASLQFPWFGIESEVQSRLYTRIFDQLTEHKQIHILRLSNPPFCYRTISNVHFAKSLIELIAKLPSLEFLSASIRLKSPESESVSNFSGKDAPSGASPEICHPPRFLRVFSGYHGWWAPPGFLDWVLGAPQLQHLSLVITPDQAHVVPPGWTSARTIVTVRANAFAFLHTLRISCLGMPTPRLPSGHPEAEDILVEILRSCISLRELRVELFKNLIIINILNNLPNSLTHFRYSHGQMLHESAQQSSLESFDSTISQWLVNPAFRTSHPYLNHVSLNIKYGVSLQKDSEGIYSPVLSRSMVASKDAGVELCVKWMKISLVSLA
jgi:hypothetical protein